MRIFKKILPGLLILYIIICAALFFLQERLIFIPEKLSKDLVFIASVAAWNTLFPLAPATYPEGHVFLEKDTPYMSNQDHPYAQAKFLADQAVRNS